MFFSSAEKTLSSCVMFTAVIEREIYFSYAEDICFMSTVRSRYVTSDAFLFFSVCQRKDCLRAVTAARHARCLFCF